MTDSIADTWKRNEPDSPCVNICLIHPDVGICIGCHRTADEIAQWSAMDQDVRLALKLSLPERAEQLKPKRRGGAARRRKVTKF